MPSGRRSGPAERHGGVEGEAVGHARHVGDRARYRRRDGPARSVAGRPHATRRQVLGVRRRSARPGREHRRRPASPWSTDVGPQVDVLVVEPAERGEGLGQRLGHADRRPCARWPSTMASMNVASCWRRRGRRTAVDHGRAASAASTMPACDRVLEVVADVGDAVGPAHDLALGRGRRRARPASGCGCRRASRRTG